MNIFWRVKKLVDVEYARGFSDALDLALKVFDRLILKKKLKRKTIALTGSLLAMNLEFILNKLLKHCKRFSSEDNIKNVLLFFYNKEKSTPPSKINRPFKLVSIDYSQEITGNFVTLD